MRTLPAEHLDNWLCQYCECCSTDILLSSSPTRDVPISAQEVTKDSAVAMESLTPSTVTSNLSIQQPKVEVDLFSQDDLNLGPFQQLETQLLDNMEISEQHSSHCHIPEVFGDEYMEDLSGNINMVSPGDTNSACVDDVPPERVESLPVTNVPILWRSSMARNAPTAPTQKLGLDRRLKHADRLRKYIKENGRIPVIFRKKDGHPIGQYASMFMTELGTAVKNLVPLKVSGWKDVPEEQKQRIFDRLESSFVVDFGLGPNSVKKETEKLMNARFRNYRRYMHDHYKTLAHLPWEERLKCVPTEYCESEAAWEFLCIMFESESFKKKSLVNSGNAKVKSSYNRRRGWKSLSQYKYGADDGSRGKDVITSSNQTDNNLEKGCPGESAMTSNNNTQIGSDNREDGSQSLEGVDAAKRASDRIQESRAAYVAGLRNGLQLAKSTSSDDTSLTATNAQLRIELASTQYELHSTRIALQLTEDRVRMLEANQKRLEETMHANTRITEANQKRLEESIQANQQMMKQVFEKIASDITQSLTQLPSSPAPAPPRL